MKAELKAYITIATGIAQLLHPYAEVVLHDLKTQKVVFLVNNFSKREIGAPSLLEEIQFDKNATIIGPYEKMNWDGRLLKSISIVIRSEQKPIGLMCINLDVADLTHWHKALSLFLHPPERIEKPERLFKNDWQEKINIFVNVWLQEHHVTLKTLKRTDKQKLIQALAQKGAFAGKNAANYIAAVLDLGRATVYKYLKETTQ